MLHHLSYLDDHIDIITRFSLSALQLQLHIHLNEQIHYVYSIANHWIIFNLVLWQQYESLFIHLCVICDEQSSYFYNVKNNLQYNFTKLTSSGPWFPFAVLLWTAMLGIWSQHGANNEIEIYLYFIGVCLYLKLWKQTVTL